MNPPSHDTVAESRRLLRAILTRRDFLAVSGSIAGLALTGCSDGSGPTGTTDPPLIPPPATIPDGFAAVNGTISLPAGSTLKLTDLSVDVGCQVVSVSAAGTFTAGVSPDGPSLALLTDKNGDGVLMSMFSAGSSQAISARTTAVTLFYYATSAYALPASVMPQLLALINSDPAITALEHAVASAVALDPHAITNNAPPLGPAITAALNTMLGTTPSITQSARFNVLDRANASGNANTSASANVSGNANANANVRVNTQSHVAPSAVGIPTLMSIVPVVEQNGLKVEKEEDATALLISNTKRRGCKVYVYQVENTVDGKTEPKNPPVRENGPIALSSTAGMSLIAALKDLTTWFYGHTVFQPVKLDAIPLILKPTNADRTVYKVVVIASTWRAMTYEAQEPAFMHEAIWSQELAAWRDDAHWLCMGTVFKDIVFPIFGFMLGVGLTVGSELVVEGVMKSAEATGAATFKRLMTNLAVGGLGQVPAATQEIVNEAFSSTISTQFWKSNMQALFGQAQAKALADQTQAVTQSRALKAAGMFQKVFAPLFAAGAVFQAWDFGAVVYDVWNSEMASLWTVTLDRQKLGLLPVEPRIGKGAEVNFTVELPANVTGTYTYEWTQNSLFATFSVVGESNIGASVSTTKRAVKLVTSGSETTPISVLVVAYDTRTLPRTEIGRAGTTVSFYYPAEILPSNAILQVKQVQPFSVNITGGELPHDIVYKWTVVGAAGTLGGQATQTTTVPQVTFTAADIPGTAKLQLEAVNAAGVIFAKTEAPIGVEFPAVIQPSNATVPLSTQQVYSVVVTGQLPQGIQYKWTLIGAPGTLAGQSTQTTTVPQVNFTAGNVPATGTLHVDVVTAAGVRWAHADGQVIVARAPSITFTLAGPWNTDGQAPDLPPNGTYNFPSFYDGRVPLESEPGIDQIGFVYNVGSKDSIGVFVAIHLQAGRVIKTGDTFSKYSNTDNGGNSNGTYQFLLSNNLTDADAPGAKQTVPKGTGNLKFDDVSRLADGTWVVNYSFKITSPAGATCVAVGAAKWK